MHWNKREKGDASDMILETKHLTYRYGKKGNDKPAVDDVSLSVRAGEVLAIIGQTGSGKSTLVQQLNGLLRPTSGQVLLNGRDIWEKPREIRSIRFQVGMVFQYPEYQLFAETVEKDIAFGPENKKLTAAEIQSRVDEAIAFVGLDPTLRTQSPFALSGGEKRRAAIAGVIAMDPEILILDEPTAGLDPQGRQDLLHRLMDYHKARHNTIILVSHTMEEVAQVADRVLVMDGGRVAMEGTPAEVFAHGRELASLGLSVPQVTRITADLVDRGWPMDRGILTVEQAADAVCAVLEKEGKLYGP